MSRVARRGLSLARAAAQSTQQSSRGRAPPDGAVSGRSGDEPVRLDPIQGGLPLARAPPPLVYVL